MVRVINFFSIYSTHYVIKSWLVKYAYSHRKFSADESFLFLTSEWSKALLLEKWMTNAVQCCEEAGIAPPASALQLVAPTPPLLTPSPPSSVITPPPPPHIPEVEDDELGKDTKNLVSLIYLLLYFFIENILNCHLLII